MGVVLTRDGQLPAGGDETVAECGGSAVIVEIDGLRPAALVAALVPRVAAAAVVVLPASADGRSLAPRLAAALERPLVAGAVEIGPGRAVVARHGATVLDEVEIDGPYVATLEPGVRGVTAGLVVPDPVVLDLEPLANDPVIEGVTAPAAADLDLAEADHILAVGAGLADERLVSLAAEVAGALGMSLGATRMVTDRGWLPFERQIGTTGVMVDPIVHVALAVSGAVQHTAGLGEPSHMVSVNTDGSCPMAARADLNIVADARVVLVALADRLDVAVPDEVREAIDG